MMVLECTFSSVRWKTRTRGIGIVGGDGGVANECGKGLGDVRFIWGRVCRYRGFDLELSNATIYYYRWYFLWKVV